MEVEAESLEKGGHLGNSAVVRVAIYRPITDVKSDDE